METQTVAQPTVQELLTEIEELRAKLKRQEELYESSNMELIKWMVQSERQAKDLRRLNAVLKRTFLDTIEIIQNIIEIKDPGSKDHAERVAKMSHFIGEKVLDKKGEVQKIVIAAKIHEVGKIAIPEEILHKDMFQRTEQENRLYNRYPQLGAACLEEVERFRDIARIIQHQKEWMNGEGQPDGLAGEEIPLGSRILAIADNFDTLYFMVQKYDTAAETLTEIQQHLGTRFDPALFPHLYAYVMQHYADNNRPKDRKISLHELKPGMVLSRDLTTVSNVLLLPKGTTFTEDIINKLLKHQHIDPIGGGVYILNQQGS